MSRTNMRRVIALLTVLLTAQVSFAQNTFDLTVKDAATKEPVVGALNEERPPYRRPLNFAYGSVDCVD